MAETATTNYEILVLFPGSMKPSESKKAIEKMEADIGRLGTIGNKTVWENRPLAYKISGEVSGTYFICTVDAAPAGMPALEQQLRLDAQVIRHLIIKTPKGYVWREYSAEDLEHDYTKISRDVFNEKK